MPPLSRRARWALAAACLAALCTGALPVLLTAHGSPSGAVNVNAAGSVAPAPEDNLAPGDPGPTETSGPSTTTTTTATTGPASSTTTGPVAVPTTTPSVIPCAGPSLAMEAATDAATYRPGDLVTVKAVVTNTGTESCLFDDTYRFQERACPIWVVVGQTTGTPPNDQWVYRLDDPSPTACQPTSAVLAPGGEVSSLVVFPFKPRANCGPSYDPCTLRAGVWTGSFTWAYGGGNPYVTADFSFTCPDGACTPPTTTSTTTSTSPPSSTSTSPPSSSSTTTSSTTATTP